MFKNEAGDEITIWKNEKCEPIRFIEIKGKQESTIRAILGRECVDDKIYNNLDKAIEAFHNVNWKAVGAIAAIVAKNIIEEQKNLK